MLMIAIDRRKPERAVLSERRGLDLTSALAGYRCCKTYEAMR